MIIPVAETQIQPQITNQDWEEEYQKVSLIIIWFWWVATLTRTKSQLTQIRWRSGEEAHGVKKSKEISRKHCTPYSRCPDPNRIKEEAMDCLTRTWQCKLTRKALVKKVERAQEEEDDCQKQSPTTIYLACNRDRVMLLLARTRARAPQIIATRRRCRSNFKRSLVGGRKMLLKKIWSKRLRIQLHLTRNKVSCGTDKLVNSPCHRENFKMQALALHQIIKLNSMCPQSLALRSTKNTRMHQ